MIARKAVLNTNCRNSLICEDFKRWCAVTLPVCRLVRVIARPTQPTTVKTRTRTLMDTKINEKCPLFRPKSRDVAPLKQTLESGIMCVLPMKLHWQT